MATSEEDERFEALANSMVLAWTCFSQIKVA